ncbi:MAG: transcription termination factor Rho [Sedimentisphaerales bacterium]|nr:transcription termination factor Rho [Sedimentisphaerales bacterium]MBN2842087.1 transcription termination factor Rho [Sedimentisphaerales bacterium]
MAENAKEQGNIVEGLLEMPPGKDGYLRSKGPFWTASGRDPFVHRNIIASHNLRQGHYLKASYTRKKGPVPQIDKIISVNGEDPQVYVDALPFEDLTAIDPREQLVLETTPDVISTRIIDLFTPIGKGQRALIVAPPRTGKTILLQQIANAVAKNYPEAKLVGMLIDERPEEVTDMTRSIDAVFFASSNDKPVDSHVRMGRLGFAYAQRLLEGGHDVVVILDSLTRLGRAFNNSTKVGTQTGRVMTGGIDAGALQIPKRLFGNARNIENGGSLTVIATSLIETGSRMDEVIFNEFKGTGNMELVLDRQIANNRIFPAINLNESGTRKEELLIRERDLDKLHRLRRHLNGMAPGQDIEMLIKAIKTQKTNKAFLDYLP